MSVQKSMFEELKRKKIFDQARDFAFKYLDELDSLDVYPSKESLKKLVSFEENLPLNTTSAKEIIDKLYLEGIHGTVTHTGGRYFGFIIGGATPISLAVKWMTDVWDQCGGLYVSSPINAHLEDVCERWLVDLFGLPEETVCGFVSGASMANFSAIATARYYIFKKLSWDVNVKGMNGAPKIRIITHHQIHASIRKNLVLLGFGDECIEYISSDKEGRMNVDELPRLDESCLIFLQAGNANSGSFDDFDYVCNQAQKAGAYVHIDGAFGLWAQASKSLSHLTKGMEKADSWAVDAHKTLNTPYDSGIVLCRHKHAMANALQATGDYIIYSDGRDPMTYTPEMSKRSRVFELWATMKYLGKAGIDEMVTTFHQRAKQLEAGLSEIGYEVLNDVVFNQVMVKLDDDDKTNHALNYIQNSGECWLGGSSWHGDAVIRVSISSWMTTEEDIRRTIALFDQAKKIKVS